MFTGLVETLGEVTGVKPTAAGMRLRLSTGLAAQLSNGESLAVNGVCLTVVSADQHAVHADISPETARVTTLGNVKRGAMVNLERPLRADGRLGGHFVQGHVDAMAPIDELRQDADSYWLTIKYPSGLASLIVRKGSIAVDGVSLTVAGLDESRFDVQIIPYTWSHTAFHHAKVGDLVNLECDIIGKYVARALEASGSLKKREG
jgi:riboflavin synthase